MISPARGMSRRQNFSTEPNTSSLLYLNQGASAARQMQAEHLLQRMMWFTVPKLHRAGTWRYQTTSGVYRYLTKSRSAVIQIDARKVKASANTGSKPSCQFTQIITKIAQSHAAHFGHKYFEDERILSTRIACRQKYKYQEHKIFRF